MAAKFISMDGNLVPSEDATIHVSSPALRFGAHIFEGIRGYWNAALNELFNSLGCGRLASIVGRYYAMDRDHRWERTQLAYDLLVEAQAEHRAKSAAQGLQDGREGGAH